MGRDKSWIEIGGRPMIESVLNAALAVATDAAIVISQDNPAIDRYREYAAARGASLIFDLHDHLGPLGGIDTALRNCRPDETALILACDLPFLTPEFLRLISDVHFEEENDLTAPVDQEGRIQMLAGFYASACLELVESLLSKNILKVDRLCMEVKSRRVEFHEYAHLPRAASLLININR